MFVAKALILAFVLLAVADPDDEAEPAEKDPIKRTEAIPERLAELKEVALVYERAEVPDGLGGKASVPVVRLINPTDRPIQFRGYSESAPWYRLEILSGEKWRDHRVGWFCGTGLRTCTIPPGRSAQIHFVVSRPEQKVPARVGVDYWRPGDTIERGTVWSERIEAEQQAAIPVTPPAKVSDFQPRYPGVPKSSRPATAPADGRKVLLLK